MRVLIADDHEVVRRGLRELLREHLPHAQFGEAGDARTALQAVTEQDWDIVLVDITMPGRSGLDLIQDVKRVKPALPILVLSAHAERDYALRSLKLGAAGYVSKQSASDVLIGAVRKVLAGGRYVSPALAEALAEAMSGEAPGEPHSTLSNRELQVLKLIASGKAIKEVAAELALSEKTVATYRARISEKMGLSTNVELTRYALQHGLVH
jgi:DNA-binding NarL/FixJ family response regulator